MAEPQPSQADGDLIPPSTSTGNSASGSNVDRVLFKNLVEMVPLVESLMDKRSTSSFSRRASIVHTAAPQLKRAADYKSRKLVQTNSVKMHRDAEERFQHDMNELLLLREQVAELERKLLEKEEALKSAESLASQVNETCASVCELRHQVSEKDALIKSASAQLYDAKVNLADKQAALEKIEWEYMMSKKKVQELQGNAVSNELEISAMMQLFEAISKGNSFSSPEYTSFEPLPPLDEIKGMDMEKMEEARREYLSAVAGAKVDPTDASLAAAAESRMRLQSFVF